MRDHATEYAAQDVTVLGVSPDKVKQVKRFHRRYELDFTLLADEDHAMAEDYGVWAEKKLYGRTYMGVLRTTILIGPDGRVEKVFEKVKPAEHDDQVIAALIAAR